jgi:hypothetical protein
MSSNHPLGMPVAPPVSRDDIGRAPAAPTVTPTGRIAVGSMSDFEFKALPSAVRKDNGRADLDLARGRNRLAVWSLWFGLVCLFANPLCGFSIAAVVRGVQGLRRANGWQRDGYPPRGRGWAVAGIVLGVVGTVLTPLWFSLYLSSPR